MPEPQVARVVQPENIVPPKQVIVIPAQPEPIQKVGQVHVLIVSLAHIPVVKLASAQNVSPEHILLFGELQSAIAVRPENTVQPEQALAIAVREIHIQRAEQALVHHVLAEVLPIVVTQSA